MSFKEAYRELNRNRSIIGKQAYKTFLGQIKRGDIDSAMKGYNKLLKKHGLL